MSLSSLNDFFESYARTLEQYDAKTAVNHYAFPCFFTSDEGAFAYTEPSKLEALFVQGNSFYRKNGIVHARPEVWSKRQWTEKLVKAKVRWSYYSDDKKLAYTCEYQYIIREMDKGKGWKIEAAVSVNEREQVEAWMDSLKQPANQE